MDVTSLPLKLRVEVLKARDLAPADTNGKSDPYCIVSLGQKVVQTSVQLQTLFPQWMQSMAFFSSDLEPFALIQDNSDEKCRILLFGYLNVEVWDKDIGNPDDFLGRVILPLSSFPLCPSHMADFSEEKWYPLLRNSTKGDVKGEIQLKIQLEAIEPDVELINLCVNRDLLTITKGLGFHLPVKLYDSQIVDFPGITEKIEIGFSKVYVELCDSQSEAMILLTNYRLIILSVGDMKGNKTITTTNLSPVTTTTTQDSSMWIGLSNISHVEHGSGNTVVRRQAFGTAENLESYSVTLHCYDCRSVRLTFVTEPDGIKKVLRNKDENQTVPKKLIKQAQEFERQVRKKKREVKIKKKMKKLKKMIPLRGKKDKLVNRQEVRRRSDAISENAFSTEGANFDAEYDIEDDDELQDCILLTLKRLSETDDQDGGLIGCDTGIEEGMEEEEEEEEEEVIQNPNITELESAYSGLILPAPTKLLVSRLLQRLEDIMYNISDKPVAYSFLKSEPYATELILKSDWNVEAQLYADMTRMMSDNWKESPLNHEYTLCPTYPPFVYVPNIVRDELVVAVSKYRSKGRIPSLVWMDKANGTFLLRSAQPLPGLSDKHSTEDETLLKYAITCYDGEGLMIFDARSSSAATGNRIMGKGTEDVSRYYRCKLTHLDIPNIHSVRESYEGLKQLALSTSSTRWYSSLESTQWIEYISLILKGSYLIARLIKIQSGSALIHCSDGWDRTSQLTSLTQIIIDSYYRTIDGFLVLIAKEWLSYGHKFKERLGHPLNPNERSPIFLQFLDCVHQLMNQYPHAFQFNLSFLLTIAEHLNTGWFGTFLFNCHKERIENDVFISTVPINAHFNAMRDVYINLNYRETKEVIMPTWTIRRLRLWEEYFLAWDGTSIASRVEIETGGMGLEGPGDFTNQTKGGGASKADMFDESETIVWMSDDKTKACLSCHKKFSILRRKHHCRKCGRIFCDDCSKNCTSLPSLGYSTPVRVCNECYKEVISVPSSQNIPQCSSEEDGFQVIESKPQPTQTNSE